MVCRTSVNAGSIQNAECWNWCDSATWIVLQVSSICKSSYTSSGNCTLPLINKWILFCRTPVYWQTWMGFSWWEDRHSWNLSLCTGWFLPLWGNVERTQNAFLHFHCNSGYMNMPQCDMYVACHAYWHSFISCTVLVAMQTCQVSVRLAPWVFKFPFILSTTRPV
jgi:hypothetical protein